MRAFLVGFVGLSLAVAFCMAANTAYNCTYTTPSGDESYDISILQRTPTSGHGLRANWYASESHEDDEAAENRDDYTYFMNLCAPIVNVPAAVSSKIAYFGGDVGVLQRIEEDTDDDAVVNNDDANSDYSTDGYVLSRAKNGPGLYRLMEGDLRYEFHGAETTIQFGGKTIVTSRHCSFKNTTIIFFCADVGLGQPVFAHESQQCEYIFVWNTCAACPLGSSIRNACPGVSTQCVFSSHLSGGAIFTIVFFSLLGAYLLIGILYNRFVNGAKGLEQLPNLDFWFACCTNIQAGFAYTLSCCRGKPKARPVAVKFQGLDDKLEDLDDDADDRLYDISH